MGVSKSGLRSEVHRTPKTPLLQTHPHRINPLLQPGKISFYIERGKTDTPPAALAVNNFTCKIHRKNAIMKASFFEI